MDDIQRAIDYFENEIRIMKRYNISLDCVEIAETAISTIQELQQYRERIEQLEKELEIKSPSNLPEPKMTLNEAIQHCQEKTDCTACGEQHRQLGEWLQELQAYRATGLTPHMAETLKENDKRSHQLAVQRAAELDEYWAIGTPEKCREAVKRQQECKNCGYKIHGERISKLHDCNDCGRKNNCSIRPAYGKYCRINCHAWTAEDKNGKIDGEKDILLD